LLSMVGVPMVAAANANTMVKGNVWAMDSNGYMIGGQPVGKATFDTQSGAWSLITTKTLPYTEAGNYYFGITTSKPVKGIRPEITKIVTIYVGTDDSIDLSGTESESPLSELNQSIANGGVFYLGANSV
jgi:hypothetical protein